MSAARPFRVGVADLLRRPGTRRDEHLEAAIEGLAGSGSHVPAAEPVRLDLELQSVNEGIVAKGTVRVRWEGECRRCLRPVAGELAVPVLEVFEDEPVEGETSLLDVDGIDLETLARETVLLELPAAPLCREGCLGLCPVCGADRNEGDCGHAVEARDPRWEALDRLRLDEPPEH